MPKTVQKTEHQEVLTIHLWQEFQAFLFSSPHLLSPVTTERGKTANKAPQNIYVNFQISLLKGKHQKSQVLLSLFDTLYLFNGCTDAGLRREDTTKVVSQLKITIFWF